MKIHLVSGFLGSGKTTAILQASKMLAKKGISTSVITNDQGKYLVDSKYVQSAGISNAEVTGGCFCCNYNQLDLQINVLKHSAKADVIFAESVGSCTDIIATVMKPLLKYKKDDIEQVTFSTFVDARMMHNYLRDGTLPFDTNTNYIWEKQLEESEVLIVNKIDLLTSDELQHIESRIKADFPSKLLLLQCSLDTNSVKKWIETISTAQLLKAHKSIDIDYNKYGMGEANLAWLDEEIEFKSHDQSALNAAKKFIDALIANIVVERLPIGHLKFLLFYDHKTIKLSSTTGAESKQSEIDPSERSNEVRLMVNARIQTTPDKLRQLVVNSLVHLRSENGIIIHENFISVFQPDFPEPTHRLE